MSGSPGCFVSGRYRARQFLAIGERERRQSGESAAGGIQARAVSRDGIPRVGANEDIQIEQRGSERPENYPVDSFQWRTGSSPG